MKTEIVYLNGVLLVLVSTGVTLMDKNRQEELNKELEKHFVPLEPYFDEVKIIVHESVSFKEAN